MKIYCTRKRNQSSTALERLTDLIGKDIWIAVKYTNACNHYIKNRYIRPLGYNPRINYLSANSVVLDRNSRFHTKTPDALTTEFSLYVPYIEIIEPEEILTTDEVIAEIISHISLS